MSKSAPHTDPRINSAAKPLAGQFVEALTLFPILRWWPIRQFLQMIMEPLLCVIMNWVAVKIAIMVASLGTIAAIDDLVAFVVDDPLIPGLPAGAATMVVQIMLVGMAKLTIWLSRFTKGYKQKRPYAQQPRYYAVR